jgi:hypothetical protein
MPGFARELQITPRQNPDVEPVDSCGRRGGIGAADKFLGLVWLAPDLAKQDAAMLGYCVYYILYSVQM